MLATGRADCRRQAGQSSGVRGLSNRWTQAVTAIVWDGAHLRCRHLQASQSRLQSSRSTSQHESGSIGDLATRVQDTRGWQTGYGGQHGLSSGQHVGRNYPPSTEGAPPPISGRNSGLTNSNYVYILLIMSDEAENNQHERIAAIAKHCVAKQLRWSTRIISTFYDQKMRDTELHANQVTLLSVPYLAGPISINKMAEYVGLDRTTLVRNLKLIEQRGLVTIKPGQDLRTRIVTLTPAGQEMLVTALPLWEEAQRKTLEMLGAQHAELVKALAMVNKLESAT
jgi:DNA-binding MarR family transcriptional regulator